MSLCVLPCSNFVIISGDSRGHTCFWEGHHGTLIKVCNDIQVFIDAFVYWRISIEWLCCD